MMKRVLIVEDEPAVIKGLTDCFQCFEHGHAYEITSAGSAREALAIAQREGFGFDLILLELHITWIGEPFHQRSEEHTSELQSRLHLVCRLLLEKKKKKNI